MNPPPLDESALAARPSGGNRRRLEASWLAYLEESGPSPNDPGPGAAPPELSVAISQFNDGEYWECHETLEPPWLASEYPVRFFYHAIIKLAVGLHHAGRHNRHGSAVKLGDAVRLLRLFQPRYMGIETRELLAAAAEWHGIVSVEGRLDWLAMDGLERPKLERVKG